MFGLNAAEVITMGVVLALAVVALFWFRRLLFRPLTDRLEAIEAKLDEVVRATESSRGSR